MTDASNEFKKNLSVRWIKAPSGATYLCSVDALERLGDQREDNLKLICVDESENPQND